MKVCPLPNQQFCNKPKDRMECEDCLLSIEELKKLAETRKRNHSGEMNR